MCKKVHKSFYFYLSLFLFSLTLIFLPASCQKHPGKDTNVLLITVSSLRPWSLSCYGATSSRTPATDWLARNGVLCERAYATSDMSTLSSCSLLTSLFVKRHSPYLYRATIPPGASSLPEILKIKGYVTGGCTGTTLLDKEVFPPASKFDEYFSPGEKKMFFRGGDLNLFAAAFLERSKGKKWFLWVNYADPAEPTSEGYDSRVSYVDSSIGALISSLVNTGEISNTLIVLTGDHGIALDEHDLLKEPRGLYEETLSVPLILSYPPALPCRRRVQGVVCTLDVAPTVLDILGINSGAYFDGRGLLPLIEGQVSTLHDCIYAESFLQEATMVRQGDFKFIRYNSDMASSHINDVTQDGAVHWSREAGARELFNLRSDARERTNLYDGRTELSIRMEELLDGWYRDSTFVEKNARAPVDVKLVVRMKLLGY